MSMIKRLGKSQRLRRFLCWLGSLYIRFVHTSGRWRVTGSDAAQTLWTRGEPFILAFWHGHLLMMPKIWRRDIPIHMLISQHRDGELIARTVAHFGIHWVAGSSTRGGGAALRSMLKALKGGDCVGITPDGPHGPATQASDGIVAVARLSGCPIIPAAWSARKQKQLRSWDRFRIAMPFTEGVFVWGTPIIVPKDADATVLEQRRQQVEESLNALSLEADTVMGRES